MARYTKAYSSLIVRLDEVETLRKIALIKERDDPIGNSQDISALCRGAVVLLSSHVESYIKKIGELALDSLYTKNVSRSTLASQFFYHISKAHINELKNTSDPSKISEKVFTLFQEDYEFWSRNGPFPKQIECEQFNKGFSNPGFNKIGSYLRRFGYESYKNDLKQTLSSDYMAVTNMINHMVDTRNKIAHGDPILGKTPSEIEDMVTLVKLFCVKTDSLFAGWWKQHYCGIR